MRKYPQIMTTGECARKLGVSLRTIAKAIDNGVLPGWRVPGSQQRRVRREDFERMCQQIRNDHEPGRSTHA